MNNPLISIIVPVYKAEKYLDKCVQSIVNQTYKNLEIILVDDGSPDNCPQMCDEWAEKDGRIKVIHKENGGAAMARNAALDIASGDYIGFVDSDDYIDENMYKVLYNSLVKNSADISLCSYYTVDRTGKEVAVNFNFKSEIIDKYELISNNNSVCFGRVLWNCLFKSDLWNNMIFPDYKKHEDVAVLPYVFYRANVISFVPEALYYYVCVDGSIMNTGFSEKDLLLFDIIEKKLDFFKDDSHYADIFNSSMHTLRYFVLVNSKENSRQFKEFRKSAKKLFKRALREGVEMSFSARLSYIICFNNPNLYSRLINLL